MPMSRPEFSQSLILSISRITTTRYVFVLCLFFNYYYSFRFFFWFLSLRGERVVGLVLMFSCTSQRQAN